MSLHDHRLHTPPFVTNGPSWAVDGRVQLWELRIAQANVSLTDPAILHTIEHLLQTLLPPPMLFAAPMGCLTGLYLLADGHADADTVRKAVRTALTAALDATEVPNANIRQCGNYLHHDLTAAQNIIRWLLDNEENWPYATRDA